MMRPALILTFRPDWLHSRGNLFSQAVQMSVVAERILILECKQLANFVGSGTVISDPPRENVLYESLRLPWPKAACALGFYAVSGSPFFGNTCRLVALLAVLSILSVALGRHNALIFILTGASEQARLSYACDAALPAASAQSKQDCVIEAVKTCEAVQHTLLEAGCCRWAEPMNILDAEAAVEYPEMSATHSGLLINDQ